MISVDSARARLKEKDRLSQRRRGRRDIFFRAAVDNFRLFSVTLREIKGKRSGSHRGAESAEIFSFRAAVDKFQVSLCDLSGLCEKR